MLQAGVDLLPAWAAQLFGIEHSPLRRSLVRATTQPVAGAMRWALRNGSIHRARKRLDLPL
jgi:uncharacterized protein (DUF2236 family)